MKRLTLTLLILFGALMLMAPSTPQTTLRHEGRHYGLGSRLKPSGFIYGDFGRPTSWLPAHRAIQTYATFPLAINDLNGVGFAVPYLDSDHWSPLPSDQESCTHGVEDVSVTPTPDTVTITAAGSTIQADSGTPFAAVAVNDKFTLSGTASNDGAYVAAVGTDSDTIVVTGGGLTDEAAVDADVIPSNTGTCVMACYEPPSHVQKLFHCAFSAKVFPTADSLVVLNGSTTLNLTVASGTIAATAGTPFENLEAGDTIRIAGTANGNDGDYPVNSIGGSGASIVVNGGTLPGTDETAVSAQVYGGMVEVSLFWAWGHKNLLEGGAALDLIDNDGSGQNHDIFGISGTPTYTPFPNRDNSVGVDTMTTPGDIVLVDGIGADWDGWHVVRSASAGSACGPDQAPSGGPHVDCSDTHITTDSGSWIGDIDDNTGATLTLLHYGRRRAAYGDLYDARGAFTVPGIRLDLDGDGIIEDWEAQAETINSTINMDTYIMLGDPLQECVSILGFKSGYVDGDFAPGAMRDGSTALALRDLQFSCVEVGDTPQYWPDSRF